MKKENDKMTWTDVVRIILRIITIGLYHVDKNKKQK